MLKIRHGFPGQRLVVLPFYMENEALNNPISADLIIHSVGYFPKAEGHYINRPLGCNEYILIYCIKGEGWFIFNNKKHIVPENHFFILPAESPHSYGSSIKSPWYIYWAHFKGSKANYIYNQLKKITQLPINKQSRIQERIDLFDEIINTLEQNLHTEAISYANLTFNHLIGTFLYVDVFRKAKYTTSDTKNPIIISLAIHFMSENMANKLTLKDLSTQLGYSESYIYRVFIKETNYAPITYFLHMKINRACQLLQFSQLKIGQIALILGFEDQYYFSRLFKKVTGKSPMQYKKQPILLNCFEENKQPHKI